jgi:cation transport ATPase
MIYLYIRRRQKNFMILNIFKLTLDQKKPNSTFVAKITLGLLLLAASIYTGFFWQSAYAASATMGTAVLAQLLLGIPIYHHFIKHLKLKFGLFSFMIAGILSFGFSIYYFLMETPQLTYFHLSILTLTALMFILYEQSAFNHSADYLAALKALRSERSAKKIKSQYVDSATDSVKIDDIIKVKAGETIPRDGIIIQGTTSIDESMLTGQFKPLLKEKGNDVIGGSLNRDSEILVKVTRDYKDCFLEHLIQHTEENIQFPLKLSKRVSSFSNSLSFLGIMFAVCLSGARFFFHMPLEAFFNYLYGGLIIFSAPLLPVALYSIADLFGKFAVRGILIKKPTYLETLANLDVLFFDKSGSLTRGDYEYAQSFIEMGSNQGEFLSATFSLESYSNHAFAKAMESHPWFEEIPKHPVRELKIHPGLGLCGYIQPKGGKEFFAAVGNLRFLKRLQMYITRDMKSKMDDLSAMGETVTLCAFDGQVRGLISISDIFRSNIRKTLHKIQKLGIELAIVTGDAEESVSALINEFKIKKIYSRCTPDEKATKIKKLNDQNLITGIVGDNEDAKAFKVANVSMSIDTGAVIQGQLANIQIFGSDSRLIAWLFKNVKLVYQTMKTYIVLNGLFSIVLALAMLSLKIRPELLLAVTGIFHYTILRVGKSLQDKGQTDLIATEVVQAEKMAA